MCICIPSYYTYSGTEYSDDHYTVYLSANSIYLVIYTICASSGEVFCPPLREGYSPYPPNRGIPL